MRKILIFAIISTLIACNAYRELPGSKVDDNWKVKPIPPSAQQEGGDPAAGLDYLIYGDYIGSGVPYEFFKKKMSNQPDTVLRREGENAYVGYGATVFTAPNGVKVVNGNCFTCHAGKLNGEVVLGLGNSFSDYRKSLKPMARLMRLGVGLKYDKDSDEWKAFEDFSNYFREMAPYIQVNQAGANPAFRLAEACMNHRNPADLTYKKAPNYEMMDYTIATDVPPLWNVKKKNALYYNGIGRGDFTKLLFQASVLGIPDSTAARQAVNRFRDVVAWLMELEPPPYPGLVDGQLAAKGETVFNDHCSKCHGTYGSEESYPNKLISLALVKTDPLYANYAFNSGIVGWYNSSWFANTEPRSYFEPNLGYVAPPLDGIWASAPYLHNGAVPTVEALLDSAKRPTYWSRSGRSDDYNHRELGWNYTALETPEGDWAFDTTLPGYSNKGHYFGDKLSEEERSAVVEYLKTL
ncbi:MAG: c-type cytochrome [Phaeodactylibacter sp.]|nr:c-type cytochrome [Phaeodactylibacter sp.]